MRPVTASLLFLAGCAAERLERVEPRPLALQAGVPLQATQARYTRFGNEPEAMPADFAREALVDEATLTVADGGQCVTLTMRTARGLDEPLSMRGVECTADGQEAGPVRFVSEATPVVHEYPFVGEAPRLFALPISAHDDRVLRIVERSAVVCCPVVGHRHLDLSIRKKHWSDPGEFVKLDFAWVLVGNQASGIRLQGR